MPKASRSRQSAAIINLRCFGSSGAILSKIGQARRDPVLARSFVDRTCGNSALSRSDCYTQYASEGAKGQQKVRCEPDSGPRYDSENWAYWKWCETSRSFVNPTALPRCKRLQVDSKVSTKPSVKRPAEDNDMKNKRSQNGRKEVPANEPARIAQADARAGAGRVRHPQPAGRIAQEGLGLQRLGFGAAFPLRPSGSNLRQC